MQFVYKKEIVWYGNWYFFSLCIFFQKKIMQYACFTCFFRILAPEK